MVSTLMKAASALLVLLLAVLAMGHVYVLLAMRSCGLAQHKLQPSLAQAGAWRNNSYGLTSTSYNREQQHLQSGRASATAGVANGAA